MRAGQSSPIRAPLSWPRVCGLHRAPLQLFLQLPSYCLSSIRHLRREVKTPPRKNNQLISDIGEAGFSPRLKPACLVFRDKIKNNTKKPNVLRDDSGRLGKKAGTGNSAIPFQQAISGEVVCGEGRGGKCGRLQGHPGNRSGGRAMATHRAPASSRGGGYSVPADSCQAERKALGQQTDKSKFLCEIARFSNAGNKCRVLKSVAQTKLICGLGVVHASLV